MNATLFLSWIAAAGGWFARVQLGGAVILGLSFVLAALVARLPERIAIRRAAVAAVLIFCIASVATPSHWSVELSRETSSQTPAAVAGDGEPGSTGVPLNSQPRPISKSRADTRAVAIGGAIALWAVGVAGILLHMITGLLVLTYHARRARDVTAPMQLLAGIPGRRRIRVLTGGPYHVPICFGLVHGTVLLPTTAVGWQADRLRAAVLHELAHLEARDDRALLATRVACALFWFNPFIWLLSSALERESDARCDEQVVRSGVTAATYARILVDLAVEGRRAPVGAAMHASRRSHLTWRVQRVLDAPVAQFRTAFVTVASLSLVLAGVAGGSTRFSAAAANVSQHDRAAAQTLRIVAAPDANFGRPLPVEIVMALSDDATAALMDSNAAEWFARGTLVAGTRIVVRFEIEPGSCTITSVPAVAAAKPAAVFLFARYEGPGQHRVRLDYLHGAVQVELRRSGLNASDNAHGPLTCEEPNSTTPAATRRADNHDFAVAACPSLPVQVTAWQASDLADAIGVLLEEPDPAHREAAAFAIERFVRDEPHREGAGAVAASGKSYQHALTAAASDPDTHVRLAAICALATVGDTRALETLSWRAAPRERVEIRHAAQSATAAIRERAGL